MNNAFVLVLTTGMQLMVTVPEDKLSRVEEQLRGKGPGEEYLSPSISFPSVQGQIYHVRRDMIVLIEQTTEERQRIQVEAARAQAKISTPPDLSRRLSMAPFEAHD